MHAMIAMLPGGLLEMGAAALGAKFAGLSGLSLGWVLAICVEAAFMLPTIYKVIRPTQPVDPPPIQHSTTLPPTQTTPAASEPEEQLSLSPETPNSSWLVETLVLPVTPLSPRNNSRSPPIIETPTHTHNIRKKRRPFRPLRLQLYTPPEEDALQAKANNTAHLP